MNTNERQPSTSNDVEVVDDVEVHVADKVEDIINAVLPFIMTRAVVALTTSERRNFGQFCHDLQNPLRRSAKSSG